MEYASFRPGSPIFASARAAVNNAYVCVHVASKHVNPFAWQLVFVAPHICKGHPAPPGGCFRLPSRDVRGLPISCGRGSSGSSPRGSCWAEGASSASARSRCPLCNPTGQGGPICYSPCPQTPGPLRSRHLPVHEALRPPSCALAPRGLSPRGAQAPPEPEAGRGGRGALQEHRGSSRFRHRASRLR